MGEVWQAYDRDLSRFVAIKIVRASRRREEVTRRFLAEAKLTAGLQHPGIVAVHEVGELPEGRHYFAMREVRGHTFADDLEGFHTSRQATDEADRRASLRGLLEKFLRVAETIAYAHSQGVVHRDLKPANIMVGEFGEVLVLDWGVAKLLTSAEPRVVDNDDPSDRGRAFETRQGMVVGTPYYMSPEQARGAQSEIGPPTDVYALGAILFHILDGRPPVAGGDIDDVLAAVALGKRRQLATDGSVPDALAGICTRATATDPTDRYGSASLLADAVRRWLTGATAAEEARRIVEDSISLSASAKSMREEARRLLAQADTASRSLADGAPIEDKRQVWALEDRAQRARQSARLVGQRFEQRLRSALMRSPELDEAHQLLADYYRDRHEEAELADDTLGAELEAALLREHDRRGKYSEYLRGTAYLKLHSVPENAAIEISRFEMIDRRLRARATQGSTVVGGERVELSHGSYRCVFRVGGRPPVVYPVRLRRGELWDMTPPGTNAVSAVRLPLAADVDPSACFVAAGWTQIGGDHRAPNALPARRVWVDDFAIQRHPITNREFLEFLNDLVAAGRTEEAMSFAPRERGRQVDIAGALVYRVDDGGRFELGPDSDGDVWDPEYPVFLINRASMEAYATWRSARDGKPWRLPFEWEWEKAARGTDRRFFPWGNHLDPLWCRMSKTRQGRMLPAPIGQYEVDESPYGVRGMGGNISDLTLGVVDRSERFNARDAWAERADAPSVMRGGSWANDASHCRSARRAIVPNTVRLSVLGLRLVHDLPERTW